MISCQQWQVLPLVFWSFMLTVRCTDFKYNHPEDYAPILTTGVTVARTKGAQALQGQASTRGAPGAAGVDAHDDSDLAFAARPLPTVPPLPTGSQPPWSAGVATAHASKLAAMQAHSAAENNIPGRTGDHTMRNAKSSPKLWEGAAHTNATRPKLVVRPARSIFEPGGDLTLINFQRHAMAKLAEFRLDSPTMDPTGLFLKLDSDKNGVLNKGDNDIVDQLLAESGRENAVTFEQYKRNIKLLDQHDNGVAYSLVKGNPAVEKKRRHEWGGPGMNLGKTSGRRK
jgi:hypothetical protein